MFCQLFSFHVHASVALMLTRLLGQVLALAVMGAEEAGGGHGGDGINGW